MQKYMMNDLGGPEEEQDPSLQPPAAPTDADRLYGAQTAGNKQQFYADLLRSFQSVLQGSAPNSGFKSDPSIANSLEKQASQPMEMVKAQMAQELAAKKEARETEKFGMDKESHKLDIQKKGYDIASIVSDSQQKEKTRDAGSSISSFARNLVKDTQTKLGKPVNDAQLEGMNAEEMYKVFPYLQDQLTQMMKQRNEELDRASREKISADDNASKSADRKQAAADKLEAQKEKRAETGSEGQKAVDKKYATDYNEFTAKGQVNVKNSIAKLESLAAELENDQGVGEAGGGRFAAVMPDVMRSNDAIRRRDAAQNEANRGLKALFPGALSDDERKAAAKEFYNDKLGNEENAKIIRQKVQDLKSGLNQELAKAQYFEKNGTLKGFEGSALQSNDFVMMQAPDGSPPVKVKKDQAQKYLDKGAKIVQ